MFIDENCSHTTQCLSCAEIVENLKQTPHWNHDKSRNVLSRTFKFKRYSQGPAFAVLVGEMADNQDHHPDLHIYYKKCVVEFTTHSAKGVSRNDFICAARTDKIFEQLDTQVI